MSKKSHNCHWVLEVKTEPVPYSNSLYPNGQGLDVSYIIVAHCKCGNKLNQDEIEDRLNK